MTRDVFDLARELGEQSIAVPPDVIKTFGLGECSVWTDFYRYLESKHGLVDGGEAHNRSRVGAALMKKLLAAEKRRLSRKGLRDEEALSWSNVNAGPLTVYGDFHLTGDGLFWSTR